MIGTLIGAGLGAVGSIFGGLSASKAMKKQQEMLEQRKQENQNWYDRRYNEDATQRADAQRILQITEENIKKRNRAAAGTAAVMGGTDESVAAQKEAGNKALADATSQIAAAGEARKDQIEQQYQARKDAIEDAQMNLQAQKAAGTAQAVKGVIGAAGNIATMFDGGTDYDNKRPNT